MDARGVAIQRMMLSGAIHHREALLHSLEAQSWPAEDDERLMVIRRIDVRGPWWQLGADAAAMAHQLVANAVHISQPGAQTADIIYFRHRTEQVVYLCLDLLRNNYQHWYWQTFIHPASTPTAILRNLLQENVFDLPDVLFRLNRARCLPALIKTLGPDNVRDIFRELCTVTQWQGHSPTASNSNTLPQEQFSVERQKILPEWADTLISLKRDALDNADVIALISLICAWKIYPHKLSDRHFSARWQQWFCDVIQGDTKSADKQHIAQNAAQTLEVESNYIPAARLENAESTTKNVDGQAQQVFVADATGSSASLTGIEPIVLPDHDIYLTQYGGIFFLINALLLTKCTDDIQASQVAPWQLIQHMAHMLGCGKDAGLMEFFDSQLAVPAEEGALQSAAHLAEKLTPQVIHRFHQHLQWNGDFFLLRARIEQRLPYINVYFHVSSIQLPLRLLGLDINPGWQPWLGQVVKYHYVTDPDLLPLNPI